MIVLIANRGEIAVRIARSVHALGLRSVAVVTEADAGAVHATACDVAVRIGSYLSAEDVLDAAARSGATAIHPGYGFLSENASFARAVTGAGLTWIGPPVAAIELMGDKGRAKEAAEAAGVPVVPAGDAGGYPVIVKAVAGGGGKGMRVVRSADELEEATAAAKREAQSSFGDDRVIVEQYLERPRHLEIQVIADAHGNVGHLGERECSLQRRHQKVVEEAPSPVVGPELRAEMGAAAVALAQACGYVGAGTVEFVAPADGSAFFFLEMNTRLQVEHPVTELVYGVDLVELQLRIARGEELPPLPSEPVGHAVEARLYAEDPAAGFLPATGTVRHYVEPAGVRTDSGIGAGSEVGTAYDPMLAKLIAYGPDRATALGRLDRGLADLELLGVTTNAAFTRALLQREDVRTGEMDTGLLERVLAEREPADWLAPPEDLLPAAALAAAGSAHPAGPWRRTVEEHGELRVADGTVSAAGRTWAAAEPVPSPSMDQTPPHGVASMLTHPSALTMDLTPPHGGRSMLTGSGGAWRITLDGIERRYAVAVTEDAIWIARDGHHLELRTHRAARDGAGALAGSLEAPMPGTVLLVHVSDGDTVEEGQVLMVLESMKMELQITAPHAGTVAGLALVPGDRVALRQPLLAVTEEEA